MPVSLFQCRRLALEQGVPEAFMEAREWGLRDGAKYGNSP